MRESLASWPEGPCVPVKVQKPSFCGCRAARGSGGSVPWVRQVFPVETCLGFPIPIVLSSCGLVGKTGLRSWSWEPAGTQVRASGSEVGPGRST